MFDRIFEAAPFPKDVCKVITIFQQTSLAHATYLYMLDRGSKGPFPTCVYGLRRSLGRGGAHSLVHAWCHIGPRDPPKPVHPIHDLKPPRMLFLPWDCLPSLPRWSMGKNGFVRECECGGLPTSVIYLCFKHRLHVVSNVSSVHVG